MAEGNGSFEGVRGDTNAGLTRRWRLALRLARATIALAVIVFFALLAYKNVAPFGATVEYHIDCNAWLQSGATAITPTINLSEGEDGALYEIFEARMITDLVTFELEVPYEDIDTAEVQIRYRGDPNELLMGLRGEKESPYLYKPVHNSSLNRLPWKRVSDGRLTLFQKSGSYGSVEEFLDQPPLPKNGDPDFPRTAEYYCNIPQPAPDITASQVKAGTGIDTALRGPHSFYIYVGKDGTADVGLTEVELNCAEGPDPLDIIVYKDLVPIMAMNAVPDDGDRSASGILSAPRETGFALEDLDAGVYRVDLVCGDDVAITNLTSEQGYLSFIDELNIVDRELYRLGHNREFVFYTNSEELSVHTENDEAFPILSADDGSRVVVDKSRQRLSWPLPPGLSRVRGDTGGMVIRSVGSSFSFSREAFFDPFPLKVVPYEEALLFTDIEYILGDYVVPEEDGDWLTRTIYFDLEGARIEDNMLGFALYSPALRKLGGEIALASIAIKLERKGRI